MFLGSHNHNLDAKGRIAIPARFRDELKGGLVVTRGFDRCIALYPMPVWSELSQRINDLSFADANVRQFRRMVFAEAIDLDLDSQGRILLPAELRTFAEIDREAIVIGVHSSIEIWNLQRWQSNAQEMDSSADDIAARLAGML